MKKISKQLLGVFLFMSLCRVGFGQTGLNAVRLDSGAQVVNTIFWKNAGLKPLSTDVSVSYSALDTLRPANSGNIQLLNNPFVNGYRINSSSPAYNAGTNAGLRAKDTLDLDYLNRFGRHECPQIDMGAFEYQVRKTEITQDLPADTTTCEGIPLKLITLAVGENVTYQWQKDGKDIIGETSSTLTLLGNLSDTGTYRAIVHGDCCNDTSAGVRVHVDVDPSGVLRLMNDTVIVSGADVELKVLSHVGMFTWYESDMTTKIADTTSVLISDITESRHYVAVSKNTCPNPAIAVLNIIVGDSACILQSRADTTICYGSSLQLLTAKALVNYQWYDLQTGESLPKFAFVRPDTTSSYLVKGENRMGDKCSDTFTVFVRRVNLVVPEEQTVCGRPGGTPVNLTSSPPADGWYDVNGNLIGAGDITGWLVQNNVTSIFIAKRSEGVCETEVRTSVYSNPPDLKTAFADTTICEGQSVVLNTNIESRFIVWRKEDHTLVSDTLHANPIVTPEVSTIYRAWVYDSICGDVYAESKVIIQQKPSFEIVSLPMVCEGVDVSLLASPNASYWTELDRTRVFFPFEPYPQTLNWTDTIIGWYTDGICLVSDTIALHMEPLLTEFNFRSDTTVFKGCEVQLWSEPYATNWTDISNDIVLGAGNHLVSPADTTVYVVEYQSLCSLFSDTVRINVFAEPFFATPVTNSDCENDGWAYVDVEGVTAPYTFKWSNGSTADTVTGLSAGQYTVTITDKNDESVVKPFTITAATPIQITYTFVESRNSDCNDGQITTTVTGGNPGYYYHWSDGMEGWGKGNRTNIEAGSYSLTVYDTTGCQQTKYVILPCMYKQVMPNLFITPNDDGKNDFLKIKYIERYPFNTVILLNSYGEEVNRLNNYDNVNVMWNGRNKAGEILPDGVYYYIVEAEGITPMVGWILMKDSKSK